MESKPFLVYKSSAGSGKTYTLVKEYLKIILQDPQKIRNILAITFTNAAAAEMKQRVIEALGHIAALAGKEESLWEDKGKGLVKTLEEETALQPFEVIRRAQLALTLILHNYGDFSISTIDSFVHRIIRSFAFDLQLPLNFDVELDQDQLLKQAVDILVSRAGSDSALTRLLVQFIENRTDEEKSHYIEFDIANMARTLMDEKGSMYIDRIRAISLDDFGRIHAELEKRISAFEETIRDLGQQAATLMNNAGVNDAAFYQGAKGIAAWFRALAAGHVAAKITPNSYVAKTIEEDKWTGGKADAGSVAAIGSIKGQLTDVYLKIQTHAAEQLEVYRVQALVKQSLFPLAVLSELEKVLDEIKSDNSLLHISDFNKRISEIVAVETAPFIYERIGERYQHYMIDEFQDTSGLQWQNLLPLVDNSLASGHMNLVVGDGKQAIYRWRNGDVEQFAALPQISPGIKALARQHWEATLQRNYNEKALDTNYRSRQQIIEFNNLFFEFAKQALPENLRDIYRGQEQKFRPNKPGGYVQLEFPEADPSQELTFEDISLQRMLDIISDLRNKGHALNEITILCRANKQASTTARFLLENGLNVISSESLLLNQSPKVNFMVTVMKLLHNPGDQVSMVEFFQFLVKSGKLPQKLYVLLTEYQSLLKTSSKQDYAFAAAEQLLQRYKLEFSFRDCMHIGLYELAETILRNFFAQDVSDPFVAFFMDVVYDYSNKFVSSPSDFLEWWAEKAEKFSVVVPEGVDAVQVMTIHKSKGLQFSVVIYPFVDMSFGKLSKQGQWVELDNLPGTDPLSVAWVKISKAMQETRFEDIWTEEKGKTLLDILNVVYVAFTRAVDKLFILSKLPGKSGTGENLPVLLMNFLQQQVAEQKQDGIYCFGENHCQQIPSQSEEEKRQTEASQGAFAHYISRNWTDRLSIRSQQLERKPLEGELDEASERGLWIHGIMEKIHTDEDVASVMKQLQEAGLLDNEEQDSLQQAILAILQNPLIAPWYGAGLDARNECGMYDSKGRFFRADRVVLKTDMAAIIDYKTGDPYPSHVRQINNYAGILEEMGYSGIKKYIVYIDHGKVELV